MRKLLILCFLLLQVGSASAAVVISNFSQTNTNGGASLTTPFGTAPTAGHAVTIVIDDDPANTITSVTTVGGTGSDVATFAFTVPSDAGPTYAPLHFYYIPSLGSSRTGIIVTYTGGGFMETSIWEVAGIASPVPDVEFVAAGLTGGTSLSGTTAALAASGEAAVIAGTASNTWGSITAGGWTSNGVSVFSGSIYGQLVPGSTSAIASTLTAPTTMNGNFGVFTLKPGSAPPTGGTRRSLTGVGN